MSYRIAWPVGFVTGLVAMGVLAISLTVPLPAWLVVLGGGVTLGAAAGGFAALWMRPSRGAVARLLEAMARAVQGDFSTRLQLDAEGMWEGMALRWNQVAVALEQQVERVREETERTTIAFDNITDGVVLTDAAGVVTLINPTAGRLFGGRRVPVVGRAFIEVVRDHELWELVQGALRSGEPVGRQVEVGLDRRLLRMTVRRLGSGTEAQALVVFQDLTEVRRLEGIRREFVANVSHELRTPLASIKVMVETLEAGALDDAEVAPGFLRRINSEVDRMTLLVRELLDLSRIETGQVELRLREVDVPHLVRDSIERLEHQALQKGVLLVDDIAEGLPALWADEVRLNQVVVNLLHNGIKFTPLGGTVTVVATADGDELEMTVVDTGIGIPEDDLPHVFERFYKADKARSSEGTGLGLAISKHIVQAHGGRLTVESVEGRGATFRVALPLVSAPRLRDDEWRRLPPAG